MITPYRPAKIVVATGRTNCRLSAIDPAARQGNLEEMADILHRGESHWVPYFWYSTAGAYDYRIRNFYYPPTVQLIKKWDHQWFDPDREMPDGVG